MTSIHCSFTIEEYQHVHDAAALRLGKIRKDKSPARHMAGYAEIKSLKSLMARIEIDVRFRGDKEESYPNLLTDTEAGCYINLLSDLEKRQLKRLNATKLPKRREALEKEIASVSALAERLKQGLDNAS